MAQKRFATHITASNGKRVYISAKTKAELEKKVLQARIEMHSGVDISNTCKFSEYGWIWLKAYKAPPKVSEHTWLLSEANFRLHVLPYFGEMRLRDVKPMHITKYILSLSGYSKSLQSKCLQMVKGIFISAVENGLIAKSPVLKEHRPCGKETEEMIPLTNTQAKEFLENVQGTSAYLFVLLGLSTGLRRGEILGLMWEDIDFDTGYIHVTHNLSFGCTDNHAEITTRLKTKTSKRDVPMSDRVKAALLATPKTKPWVFQMQDGRPMSKAAFRSMWAVATRRLPSGVEECHPHILRHTFTSQCVEHMDPTAVQHLLGHKNIEVTMKVYDHFRQESRREATARKLNDAMAFIA